MINDLIINDNLLDITIDQKNVIEKSIKLTLKQEQINKKVNVIFVTEKEIQRINLQFRGIDKITDVLSFQNYPNNEYNWPKYKSDDDNLLGEIIICFTQLKRQSIEQNVEIKGIGIYTLGKYRKTISETQKQEYNELFRSYFLKSFSSRLSEYTDPKINVLSQEILSPKYTIVSSILVASENRPEIKIEWRVYTKNPEKPLIRDLIIEGISLARTQKEEFNSVIQSAEGNINALFDNLRKFNN